jgi:hypothetical protein
VWWAVLVSILTYMAFRPNWNPVLITKGKAEWEQGG